jgi:4-hydroxy-4-methyl-2-oxoglutarate aldolase
MVKYETSQIFEELKKYDTPTVTNAVGSYPNDPKCLAIYNAWKGKWYTDHTLKCMYPELGRRIGHVVTAVYAPVDHDAKSKYTLYDILKAIESAPKPVILAIKQDFPDDMKGINGLAGGMMMSSFRALGVEGVLSDGPSRDLDEVRNFDIQYMLTGVTPGHGDMEISAVNVPVNICGMDLMPGDIVHMDENGACKFPGDRVEEVAERCQQFSESEGDKQKRILEADTALDVIKILIGSAYGE